MVFNIKRNCAIFFSLKEMYIGFYLVNLIAFASLDTVWIYKYDLKNDHKIPELVLCCPRAEKNEEII